MFESLLGKIIVKIDCAEPQSDEITIYCDDGTAYVLNHEQECCECVYVEDIIGNIDDLLHTPITMADVVSE